MDHPLLRAPRTVLTPHLGYVTAQSYARFYGEAFDPMVIVGAAIIFAGSYYSLSYETRR